MAQARALRPGDAAFNQIRDGQLSRAILDDGTRIAAAGLVTWIEGKTFTVVGDHDDSYRVVLTIWATRGGGTCTCPCPKLCKHVVAAAIVLADLTGTPIPGLPVPVAS